MTTSLGDLLFLFKDFRLSIYISILFIISLFVWVGFLADVSGGLGMCHHIQFWGVTNGIRARLHRSHMYKPSLSRVSRIGTETSILIFERL